MSFAATDNHSSPEALDECVMYFSMKYHASSGLAAIIYESNIARNVTVFCSRQHTVTT